MKQRKRKTKKLNKVKRNAMINIGFAPVTDEFWIAVGKAACTGQGFDWAYYVQGGKQNGFMPFHGWFFNELSPFEIETAAIKAERILKGEE